MVCEALQHGNMMICDRCDLAYNVQEPNAPLCRNICGAFNTREERAIEHAKKQIRKYVPEFGRAEIIIAEIDNILAGKKP